jgi:hypothetical protein
MESGLLGVLSGIFSLWGAEQLTRESCSLIFDLNRPSILSCNYWLATRKVMATLLVLSPPWPFTALRVAVNGILRIANKAAHRYPRATGPPTTQSRSNSQFGMQPVTRSAKRKCPAEFDDEAGPPPKRLRTWKSTQGRSKLVSIAGSGVQRHADKYVYKGIASSRHEVK